MAELTRHEPLRQESVVALGDTEVTVVTEVLLEPEALVVTRVLRGDEELRKQHVPVPAAAVYDYERRGRDALKPCLHASHLRYVQRLLLAPGKREEPTRGGRAGVVATMVLGAGGDVLHRAGEDHVPGPWLRTPWMVAGLADQASEALGLGALRRGALAGDGITAVIGRGGGRIGALFVDPKEIEDVAELEPLLGEVTACDTP